MYRKADLKKIGELWQKQSVIGRLHNIVQYIRASSQRRQFFRSIICSGDLAEFDGLEVSLGLYAAILLHLLTSLPYQLVQSQQIHWNSYFISIG